MSITIASIDSSIIHYVTTNEGEYTRHNGGNWYKTYGMSEEFVSDPTELENAFQQAMDVYA